MTDNQVDGDFAVPELVLGSDGYGGFDVFLKLTGARTCECPADRLGDAKRDMQSLEASMWLASVVPIGKPGTPERVKGLASVAEVTKHQRETALATLDNWIQELQTVREQLANAPVQLEEVERVEDIIDV